jgi:anaerobic magnesium-protoporphyrin IX monomethyl ester cyclase
MRILIGIPESIFPPAGPAYVAAALKKAGHDVAGCVFSGGKAFQRRLSEYEPQVVMTGGLCTQLHEIESMVCLARRAEITTVLGGGIVSAEPELMMEAVAADYGVIGQGEQTSIELIRALESGGDTSHIRGVIQKTWNRFVRGAPRPEIMDLDSLPFPDYGMFGYQEQLSAMTSNRQVGFSYFDNPRPYPLVASRSCPFHCTFCYHPSGYKYRRRSLGSVQAELEWAVRHYRANWVLIYDECFSDDVPRLKEFCRYFQDLRRRTPWELGWSCSLRLPGMDGQVLDLLKASGCFMVGFGFESYSAEVLKSMKKHITPEQIHFATHALVDRQMNVASGFILGDRSETKATARQTIDFFREHADSGVRIGTLIVCPSSPDYLHCVERGLIKDRLRHVRSRMFEPINMTRMTDWEFYSLVVEIMTLNTLVLPWTAPQKRVGKELSVKCLGCGVVTLYKNFPLGLFDKRAVICRNCGRSYFVSRRLRIVAQRLAIRLVPKSALVYYAYRTVRRLLCFIKGKARPPGSN